MAKPLKKVRRKLRAAADEVGVTTPKTIKQRAAAPKKSARKK